MTRAAQQVSEEAIQAAALDVTQPAAMGEEQTVLQELGSEQTFLPCPGDDTIALLLDDELETSRRQEVDHHVDRCHTCRRLLVGLARDDAREVTLTSASVASVRRLEPGESLGNYVVSHLIGEGGMGAVYLARDALLERDVALKVLGTPVSSSASGAARLLDEARATARLNHPNIVTIHAVGEERNTPFLALEHVPGQRLRDWLDASVEAQEVGLGHFASVATALSVAHDAGVVHRDLKPENVLLRDDGVIKVVDFGLAGGLQPATGDTRSRLAAGTPRYMAPEQWRGDPQGTAVDVWAFGVMLFEWVAGEHPFGAQRGHGLDQASLRSRVLAGDRAPLPTRRGISPALHAALEACLALEPTRRPPIAEVRDALVTPVATGGRPWLVLAAVAALVLGAAGLWAASDPAPAEGPLPVPSAAAPAAPAPQPAPPPTAIDVPETVPRRLPSPASSASVPQEVPRSRPAPAPAPPAVVQPSPKDLYREW